MPRRKPTPAPSSPRIFPLYRELKFTGGSKRALVQALERDGCYVGPCAQDMITQSTFAAPEGARALKLARVQLRSFGLTEWVGWNEVLKAAAKAGAEKLPAEAAARLRLELPEQQPGDHFWILMDPIVGSDGEPYVFYLACHDDGERRLLGRYVSPARRFFPHREIVFALRS
jgi:hypothetical protein